MFLEHLSAVETGFMDSRLGVGAIKGGETYGTKDNVDA